MDISALLQRHLTLFQVVLLIIGVICLARPAVRFREPEFKPKPNRVTYKRGEKARLFCSVKYLGERTVIWRKIPHKNPLTIGLTTWIEDPRISVEHSNSNEQWDLLIDGVTPRDMGEYECQVSISKKLLRKGVELFVTEESSSSTRENISGQVKRNPEIAISGTHFVSRGENISLYCNVSLLGHPRRELEWSKGSDESFLEGDRVSLANSNSPNRDLLISHLRIHNAQSDDSGRYTCRTHDEKLLTSAQVTVLTGGSNNVKRAGLSSISQESCAVMRFHSFLSHSTLVLVAVVIQIFFT